MAIINYSDRFDKFYWKQANAVLVKNMGDCSDFMELHFSRCSGDIWIYNSDLNALYDCIEFDRLYLGTIGKYASRIHNIRLILEEKYLEQNNINYWDQIFYHMEKLKQIEVDIHYKLMPKEIPSNIKCFTSDESYIFYTDASYPLEKAVCVQRNITQPIRKSDKNQIEDIKDKFDNQKHTELKIIIFAYVQPGSNNLPTYNKPIEILFKDPEIQNYFINIFSPHNDKVKDWMNLYEKVLENAKIPEMNSHKENCKIERRKKSIPLDVSPYEGSDIIESPAINNAQSADDVKISEGLGQNKEMDNINEMEKIVKKAKEIINGDWELEIKEPYILEVISKLLVNKNAALRKITQKEDTMGIYECPGDTFIALEEIVQYIRKFITLSSNK